MAGPFPITGPVGGAPLEIDGAFGEGGGQILRTALSLSMCRKRPFRIRNIRRARRPPGLRPQHLMAVQAAATVSGAAVEGAEVGSAELVFRPGPVGAGNYEFDIGTAGSTSLVLQTVLPALLAAPGESRLTILGGTHIPHAPPFEFLAHAYLPVLRRMGAGITLDMARPGYYPRGGGCVTARIEPAVGLAPIHIERRGRLLRREALATLSHLPGHIARRELEVLHRELGLTEAETGVRHDDASLSPGNYVTLTLESENVTEVFTGLGERGVPAETVAGDLAEEARSYLGAGVPVGPHLADQLLLPLALAGGGSFGTLPPTLHARTNMAVIGWFLDVRMHTVKLDSRRWRIEIASP